MKLHPRHLAQIVGAATLALISACTTLEAHLSVVVPRGMELSDVDLSRIAEGVSVRGSDTVSLLLFVPLGRLDLDTAVRDAIGERTDVVLVDVVVERHLWWAVLFGQSSLRLRGVMVPLPRRMDQTSNDPAGDAR